LASCWTRIEQDGHLMGRAGLSGDEIGAAIISARLVRDLMRLCFLMERQYAPYSKWFGTAFKQLACAGSLSADLKAVLNSSTWQQGEKHLVSIYEYVARQHNELAITKPLPAIVGDFFDRPFQVISKGEFSAALRAEIKNEKVRALADRCLIGNIDLASD